MLSKALTDYCHKLLRIGVQQLGLPLGIVSRVYNGSYQIIAINSAAGVLKEGAVFPIGQTYCREVVQTGQVVTLTEIDGVRGLKKHPLYIRMPLEAYISAPIFHDGVVWGTINFTSMQDRPPFRATDIECVTQLADHIASYLDQMEAPRGYGAA
jgi:GAF domain-containing protein